MNLYEEFRQRMKAAETRQELAEAYREAIEAHHTGKDLLAYEMEELTSVYVDLCGENGWNL